MKSFGTHIRRVREEKGDTLKQVAAHLAIDVAVLSKIERGQRRANRQQVQKLAEYFLQNQNASGRLAQRPRAL